MSNEAAMHGHPEVITTHEVHHDEHVHHHKETFITKYVFSQDHKMIAKQFLITGMIWAILGALMSVLFRLQIGYPDQTFPWLEDILGLKNVRETDPALNSVIELLIEIRKEARAGKDFATSDKIRNDLSKAGILLKDEKNGNMSWEMQ